MEAGNKDTQLWCMLCHLTALSLYVGLPFGNIIGPLIIWLIKKGEIPAVDKHGKESLNFQISMTIYGFAFAITVIGIPLAFVVALADLVLVIIATVKSNQGAFYRYPLTIRFIK